MSQFLRETVNVKLPGSRQLGTELLGRMGPVAKEAVPALKTLLSNENPRVRAAAADALKKIESPAN